MNYKVAIDADSMLYTSCYRNQSVNKARGQIYSHEEILESFNLEYAYMDFVSSISRIVSATWAKFELSSERDDKVSFDLFFSPKKTFRNALSEDYKAKRKPTVIVGIKDLKDLVSERLGSIEFINIEADDAVITSAYEEDNIVIACIDKDIYTHSPVWCLNYKTWEWIEPLSEEEIEDNYYYQAIMGDSTDGIKGADGIGKVGANKLCYNPIEPMTYEKYISLFDTEDDAILSMRLVRLDQYRNGELKLWESKT